ncbi:S9 family peptidase [Mucilaginibacter auburnensis]|uniref:Dipeptidyl aminopeptidase/acylaminoacyl peptidase n=1 Tax=Mucilaginibacter auburnensis TaxID=1457233 RepID=A0A2H9VW97_9SPHI|nr:prolyl oligopeptidase family serine peptidase [Mucilaginibacter auburnensis]PJJ85095.1 dipeptidyl aminopeptidase/acylaminoacyl peptidase [Mucilaginibacter auburnensis]
MKRALLCNVLIAFLAVGTFNALAQSFSMKSVIAYPFPRDITSSATGAKIAVSVQQEGKRNIYVAEGPVFELRKLTNYQQDDGQEITSLSVSADGQWVTYVRGGEHSGNRDRSMVVNPANNPVQPKIEVWSVKFAGGIPKKLGEGDYAVPSPKSNKVAWINDNKIWIAAIDGAAAAKCIVDIAGECGSLQWSPDGSKLAFVCNRTDHTYIGVYTNAAAPVKWLAPSFSKDASPRWSPDGGKITFIRTLGQVANAATQPAAAGSAAQPSANRGAVQAWSIWTADVATGEGKLLWKSGDNPRDGLPGTDGGANLYWAANRIVFCSYQDGWPHMYSIDPKGGQPLLLTPGDFQAEQIKLSGDGKWLIFSANTGPDAKLDIDRRHVLRVSVDKADMEVLTPGTEMETYPVLTGDGLTVAMFTANGQRPLTVAVMPLSTRKIKQIGEQLIPVDFPVKQMVIPKQVIYTSPDGQQVHAQLFEPVGGPSKKPAIVYIHGGPQRQMLLGWHHMDYYAIDYALNQYLAGMGFIVLSVNYRNGIGYGYDFNRPTKQGANYIDVKAGGEWLASQPNVDTTRLGVYGGSAGGALTASALARDSKLFKAGVIIHGNSQEPLDAWTSPTMIIHGDDDRNVAYSAGVSLVRRFEQNGKPYFEYLAIPGDSHHWMAHSNILKVNTAAADFLKRMLLDKK